jgi:hypothetical protein
MLPLSNAAKHASINLHFAPHPASVAGRFVFHKRHVMLR